MNVVDTITAVVTILGLAATALLTLVRIVRGPTILDRMIASDVLLTTIVLAVGADMVLRNHTAGIPVMVAVAATAVLATIVVALFVRRRDRGEHSPVPGVSDEPDGRRDV